jgi:hypothetical protein
MQKQCEDCGSTRFHRSKFRFHDIVELLMFRYPVRCYDCHHRTYDLIFRAMRSGVRKH